MEDINTVTFDASQYQLVPKTPTAKMADASYQCAGFYHDPTVGENRRISIAWSAMLAAAPTPAAQSAATLSDWQWIELANRHVASDWGCDKPDGFLNAVKALCVDFAAHSAGQEPAAYVRHLPNSAYLDSTGCKTRWEDLPDGTPVYANAAPVNASVPVALTHEQHFTIAQMVGCSSGTVAAVLAYAHELYPAPVNSGERGTFRCATCRDGELFPQYGVAPHKCFYKIPGATLGQSELLPRSEWPENFTPDAENPQCGTWTCPDCGPRAADAQQVGGTPLPKHTEWMHLRTHGQWSDGVPAWARDHSGRMNDFAAALAVISELYDALTSPAKEQ